MTRPKYKIGDSVIAKAWLFFNVFEVKSAWWNETEWRYALGKRGEFFQIKTFRSEDEIISYESISVTK